MAHQAPPHRPNGGTPVATPPAEAPRPVTMIAQLVPNMTNVNLNFIVMNLRPNPDKKPNLPREKTEPLYMVAGDPSGYVDAIVQHENREFMKVQDMCRAKNVYTGSSNGHLVLYIGKQSELSKYDEFLMPIGRNNMSVYNPAWDERKKSNGGDMHSQ